MYVGDYGIPVIVRLSSRKVIKKLGLDEVQRHGFLFKE